MVAPMMEVKNSGADPPAAIQVASNNLKCIQMSDVCMHLFLSSRNSLGCTWLHNATHISHFNPFHPFLSRGIKRKQVAPATSGVRFHASHKRSIDPAK